MTEEDYFVMLFSSAKDGNNFANKRRSLVPYRFTCGLKPRRLVF
jgi:hypothetical protein